MQIRVARGEALPFTQADLAIKGHAIELRVCAEDPMNNFLPSVGRLHTYKIPKGAGVRVDDGFEEGMEIPIFYDPMIAKLIVRGQSREEAMVRMKRALEEFVIEGIKTTIPFHLRLMRDAKFWAGQFTTSFLEEGFDLSGLE